MLATCIQECYHGTFGVKFAPEGGEKKDGVYDIDPMDPIATYFEFPKGTVKYHKRLGTVIEGEEIPEVPVKEPATVPKFTKVELQEKLTALKIEWTPIMSKDQLTALLAAAKTE